MTSKLLTMTRKLATGRGPLARTRLVLDTLPELLADLVAPPALRLARQRRLRQEHRLSAVLGSEEPDSFTHKLNRRILTSTGAHAYFTDKRSAPWVAAQLTSRDLAFADRYGTWSSIQPSDLAGLPRSFVLKANFGSGANLLVDDKEALDFAALDDLDRRVGSLRDATGRRSIAPVLIAEEYLRGVDGQPPDDLKVHCFRDRQGSFRWFLQVDRARFGAHTQDILTDDLRQAPFRFTRGGPPAAEPPRLPESIDDVIAIARDLSAPFSYIRIDLYVVGETVYFGEFTPFHWGGWNPITPVEWDQEWGAAWGWPDRMGDV